MLPIKIRSRICLEMVCLVEIPPELLVSDHAHS